MSSAVVTGASGQDGRLMLNLLNKRGHRALGVGNPLRNLQNPQSNSGFLSNTNMANMTECFALLDEVNPKKIFHFATFSRAPENLNTIETEVRKNLYETHILITYNILSWMKVRNNNSHLVVALSSLMYDSDSKLLITEHSVPNPNSYYGETKVEALKLIRKYRKDFGIRASGAILFNHTSPLSGSNYLFKEISFQLREAINTDKFQIVLSNPDALLDIISAEDAVDCCYKISNLKYGEDFVICRGTKKSIRDIIEGAVKILGIPPIKIEPRPLDIAVSSSSIWGSSQKAMIELGWTITESEDELLARIAYEILEGK